MQFIFDLLNEWEFDLQLEKIEPANAKTKKPKILEYHGEPPGTVIHHLESIDAQLH